MIDFFYNKNLKIKYAISLFCIATYMTGIQLSGGNAFELLYFFVVSTALIIGVGYTVYKVIDIEKYIEDFTYPLVFTIGCGGIVANYCVVARFQNSLLFIPIYLLTAYGLFHFYKDYKNIFNETKQQINFLIFAICCLLFVYTFCGVAKYAHPAAVGEITLSQDFMWNVGNAKSFSLGFPPTDLRFFDVRLQYHYFTELLAAALGTIMGIDCYDILAFYSQSIFLPALIITLYLFAKKIYNNIFKANIFTISIFAFGCLSLYKILPNGASAFSNSLIKATLTNINSMSNAFCFTAIFTLLFFNVIKLNYKVNIWYYLVMFGSFILLTFSKSPIAAIIVLAIVASQIARFLQGNFGKKEILFTVVFSLVFLVIYIVNFSSGANVSTRFTTYYTLEQGYFCNISKRLFIELGKGYWFVYPFLLLAQSICIAPFTLPIFLISAVKKVFKFKVLSFEELYCYAIGVGGFIAFFLSYHEAFSQVYFMYIAVFFVNLIAIKEFEFKKINFKNAPFYFMLTASLITSIFLYTNLLGSGLRQYMFNLDIMDKYDYRFIIKSEDELAGDYLNEVKTQNDMFATNRIHTGDNEGLSNVYSCFSGMQGYMEGFRYAVSNMGVSKEVVNERLKVNNTIFSSQSSHEQVVELCKENGITYLIFSEQFEGSTKQLELLEKVFDNKTVKIYKVV